MPVKFQSLLNNNFNIQKIIVNFLEALENLRNQVFSLDKKSLIAQAIEELQASGIANQTLKVGDAVPDFTLTNALGQAVELQKLLTQGPVVISFYRGVWCPFCNLELREYEQMFPAIKALGANLIAISPQILRYTLLTAQENNLSYDILSDQNNHVARQFGLVFQVPDYLKSFLSELGYYLPRYYGNGSLIELPIPATFVVNQDGKIAYDFVDPDHTKRLDPVDIVNVIKRFSS